MKTGRLLRHDPQSRAYAAVLRMLLPHSVLHRLDAGALDQGNLGACTGFAAAQWLNCRKGFVARKRFNDYRGVTRTSAYTNDYVGRYLYNRATIHDDFPWTWPHVDGGSSGLGVAKALKAAGAIDRYDWTFSFGQFIAYAQRQPVLVGTVWTDSMFDPDSNGIIRAGGGSDQRSGHEYLVRGINWSRKLVRIRNSWGPDWGIKGDAYIPFYDMEWLLSQQGDVVVPVVVPTTTPVASVVIQ